MAHIWRAGVSVATILQWFALVDGAPKCALDQLSSPNCGEDDPECPVEAPFHAVNISVDGTFRYIATSYCPPYDWSCLKNQKGRRPCARRQNFKVPLYPTVAEEKIHLGLGWPSGGKDSSPSQTLNDLPSEALSAVKPMLGAIGVLVNGVPLNGIATKLSEALPTGQELQGEDRWVNAVDAEGWMDDECFGHLSGGGNYHAHGWTKSLDRKACGLPEDVVGEHSKLIGWAFDGYGLYGPNDEGGVAVQSGVLDQCGGHSQPERGYHYHLVDHYPYQLECFHGCPEPSNNFRFKDRICVPQMREHTPMPPPPTRQHQEL